MKFNGREITGNDAILTVYSCLRNIKGEKWLLEELKNLLNEIETVEEE